MIRLIDLLLELKDNDVVHGLYDPDYEEYGLVLFSTPKQLEDFKSDPTLKQIVPYLKKAKLFTGSEFKKKYIQFENKKLQKVVYTKKIKLGNNLGNGEYWCTTEYCIEVYSGQTPDSRVYEKYVDSIIDRDLPNNFNILVKEGFVDDIRFG